MFSRLAEIDNTTKPQSRSTGCWGETHSGAVSVRFNFVFVLWQTDDNFYLIFISTIFNWILSRQSKFNNQCISISALLFRKRKKELNGSCIFIVYTGLGERPRTFNPRYSLRQFFLMCASGYLSSEQLKSRAVLLATEMGLCFWMVSIQF